MSDNNDWGDPKPSTPDALPGEGEGWGDEHDPAPIHDVDDQQWGVAPPPAGPPGGPPMPGNPAGGWTPPPNQPMADGSVGNNHVGAPPVGAPPMGPPAGGPGNYAAPPQSPYGQAGQAPQNQMMRPPPSQLASSSNQLDNNDAIALVANFFIPGVGYLMLGQSQKGIATLVLTFFTCGASYLATIVFVADAYMVALARKQRPVGEWEFFPK